MEVLDERPWSWMLFSDGGHLLLSVMCGGVGVYEVNFELTVDEATNYRESGSAYVDQLAGAVRATPTSFLTRGPLSLLPDGPAKSAALAEWRQRRPAR